MKPPLKNHPNADELRAFGNGKLSPSANDTVVLHLETCIDCREVVASSSGDSFVNRLRAAKPAPAVVTAAQNTAAQVSPAEVTDPDLPPELANNPDYEKLEELGAGGMGVVYKAFNIMMGRHEVLKVMNRDMMARSGAIERFRREVQSAARLDHPNIVRAYSARQLGDLLVFSMEFVPGEELGKLVRERGALPIAHACYYVQQVANGLQHAHEKGMVHRDIKPANLILRVEGKKHTVKVLDFGLAKMTSERGLDAGLTGEGRMLGTPDYIAPEQILDAQSAGIRADIYSLGCTLHFLLTGGPPFHGESLYDLLRKHQEEDPEPLSLLRPEVPDGLVAVIAKMMAKDPARRYQTPDAVAKALTPFVKPDSGKKGAAELLPIVAPLPNERKPTRNMWETLDPSATKPVVAKLTKPRRGARGWAIPTGIVAALLLGLFVAMQAGVFSVKTKHGTIVIENLPPDAEVFVDDQKVTVKSSKGIETVISVDSDSRRLKIVQGDTVLLTKDVAIGKEGEQVRYRLEPLVAAGKPPAPPAKNPKTDISKPADPPKKVDTPVVPVTGNEVFRFEGHSATVNSVAISRDGTKALSASSDKTVRLWSIADRRELHVLNGHSHWVWRAQFSADGLQAFSCGADATCRTWDLKTGKELTSLTDPSEGSTAFVAVSEEPGYALSLNEPDQNTRKMALWDLKKKQELHRFDTGFQVWGPVLSPDGKRVLYGGGVTHIELWDTTTRKSIRQLVGHTGAVPAVKFSPDGAFAVSGSWDKSLIYWDVESGKAIHTLTGHTDQVLCVAVSPDGKRALSGSKDQTVRLWDLGSGKELCKLEGHTDAVGAVAFSPDGEQALSGSADKTVRLWRLSSPKPAVPVDPTPVKPLVMWTAEDLKAGRIAAPDLSKAKVLFEDKFKDQQGGFETDSNADGAREGYSRGKYVITHPKARTGRAHRKLTESWGECAYEVRAKLTGNDADSWDFQINNFVQKLGAAVRIRNDGFVSVWSGAIDAVPEGLKGPELKPTLHATFKKADWNNLLLVFRKGSIEVYLNEKAVCSPIPVDVAFDPNRLQFVLRTQGPGEVEFERITVYSLDGVSTPSAPLPKPGAPFAWPADALREGRIPAPDMKNAKRLYHHAQHVVENKAAGAGNYPGSGSYTNFACQITGRTLAPGLGWGLGICDGKKKPDLAVSVMTDGTINIRRAFYNQVRPAFSHAAIKKGKEFNTLLLVVRGRTMEVYVNSIAVCDPLPMDKEIVDVIMWLHFHAVDKNKFDFKDFTVWSAENIPTPAERMSRGDVPVAPKLPK
jgi:serine/threonine protein kinase/WD40 repeat protein